MTDEELNALVHTLWHGEVTLATVVSSADAITTLRAQLAEARAERDDALRGKECFQRMTRAHWDALCAMRNEINEYIPMPNTDSGPLFSPEDGPIYADIAERVIADLKESRAYALALEAELKARAEQAEAALAAQIEADACDCPDPAVCQTECFATAIRNQPHDRTAPKVMHEDAPAAIIGEIGNQIHNIGCELQNDEDVSLQLSDLACRLWDAAKLFPTEPTALERHDAKTREKALREAAAICKADFDCKKLLGVGVEPLHDAILALIGEPNAR